MDSAPPPRTARRTILFVDDEDNIRTLFKRSFGTEFDVIAAENGPDAIARLEARAGDGGEVPLVVSDQRMPGMTGVQLLAIVKERWPDTVRVVATAYDEAKDVIDAVNLGEIWRFIRKPWDREEMRATLRGAIETHDLRLRNKRLTRELLQQERLATIGKLVTGIAHEVKNQLIVVALADVIEKRYADDRELREMLDVMRGSLSLVRGLVEGVRDFALKRHDELEKEEASLADVVNESLALMRCDLEFKRATVESDLGPPVPALPLHRGKMKQVLVNLLKNASQSLGPKGGRIAVRVGRDAGHAIVAISDDGCGMPPEVLARLGEPFFTTKGEKGTGLGLGICREIVEDHGGRIAFDSAPGRGTTAIVYLPLDRGEQKASSGGLPVTA